jgi:hypothetical protein
MTQTIETTHAEPTARDGRYGSRKFLLALLLVIGSTGLLLAAAIDAATWREVVIWVTGLYMAGNGATAWAGAFVGRTK